MNDLDWGYICTIIANLSGNPVRLFRGEQQIFYHSAIPLPKDPICVYWDEIQNIHAHVSYFTTQHFHYYGVVNSGDLKFVIGPTRQVLSDDQELRELAFRADVPAEDVDDFVAGMKSIVRLPLDSMVQMLCTVNYILNDEKLELKDISIVDDQQDLLTVQLEHRWADPPGDLETHDTHSAYMAEQQVLRFVRQGDSAALENWIATAPAVRGGVLAVDQLRQLKNTFVVSASLVSRAAIHGGMTMEDAFALSDAYIQKCELLSAPAQIANLQYHMVLEYARRVERLHAGENPTQLTIAVSNYIQHHLSQPITVDAIAKELFMSRPYLSRRFKAETGESLTDFILHKKTEEAKRLLRYSGKPAVMIGSYLGFSSQSHFCNVFKKYTGRTPSEYREKYQK